MDEDRSPRDRRLDDMRRTPLAVILRRAAFLGALCVGGLGSGACGGAAPSPEAGHLPKGGPGATGGSNDANLDPIAIAAAIDPGPAPLLAPLLPFELKKAHDQGPLGPKVHADTKLAIVRDRQKAFMRVALLHQDVPVDDELLGSALEVIDALEPLATKEPLDREGAEAAMRLDFFYSLVKGAAMTSAAMPSVLLPTSTAGIAKSGLTQLYAAAVRDDDTRDARMVALALRGGEDLVLADALWSAAARIQKTDRARANAIREESMRRRKKNALAFDYISLAFVRYSDLDAKGGRALQQRALETRNIIDPRFGDATSAIVDHQLVALDARAKSVDEVLRTEGKTGADDRLAHSRGLFALGQFDRAEAEANTLIHDEPDDARPFALLARVEIAKNGATDKTIRAAAKILEAAATRTKRDAQFYDADVGLRVQVMFWDILANISQAKEGDRVGALERESEKVRDVAKEVALNEPARAEVILFLLEVSKGVIAASGSEMGARLVAFADRAEALRKKYPDSAETAELARSLGVLSSDRVAGLRVLDYPWPKSPEPETLELALFSDRIALAEQWNAIDKLPSRAELADFLGRSPKDARALRVLDADAAAVRANLTNDKALWADAATAYEGAFITAPDDQKARVLASYGAALAASGREDDARKLLATVFAANPDGSKLRGAALTLAALNVGRVDETDSEIAFANLAAAGNDSAVALQAKAWLVYLAQKRGDKARAKTLAKELTASMSTTTSRLAGVGSRTDTGAIFASSFQFFVHFTPTHETLYHLDMNVRLDLMFARISPLSQTDLQKIAGTDK